MLARRFVPPGLSPVNVSEVTGLLTQLLERPTDDVADLRQLVADWSELACVVSEHSNWCYIQKTCHTEDSQAKANFLHVVEQLEPALKPLESQLKRKVLASPRAAELADPALAQARRQWQAEVELYRDANVPLQAQESRLESEYGELMGAMVVTLNGQSLTLQQASRELEETDRARRQAAWEQMEDRRLQDADRVDELMDQLLGLRQSLAQNAGMPGYRDYAWLMHKRFDYTPDDCHRYADAVGEHLTPVIAWLRERRQASLGVETLRPWDLSVDPQGRPPLRPFPPDRVDQLVAGVGRMVGRVSPALAEQYATLKMGENLDLDSRQGKAPGGYQSSLEARRQPFIFMNAAGMHSDVQTLLHEAGHAFHYQAACAIEPVFARHAPIEFCEVASFGMELLGSAAMDEFYGPQDAARARRKLLERCVELLPWVATVDQFQHWMYSHVGHTRAQRQDAWVAIADRFGPGVDHTGLERQRRLHWQRQPHLFGSPFYYIEYGIAMLGALQLWRLADHDRERAIAGYRSALALGGTRPLPELFAAAGIRLDFSPSAIRDVAVAVRAELERLAD